MLTIHCTACGRTYNYRNSELCPRCGAYNRPPHRVRIDSDGTICAAAEAPSPKPDTRVQRGRVRDGKLCYEEKECHENKTCYEESARRVRNGRGDGYQPESRPPRPETDGGSGSASTVGGLWQQLENGARKQSEANAQQLKDVMAKLSGIRRTKGKTTGVGTALAIAVAVLVALLPKVINSCQFDSASAPVYDYSSEAIQEDEWEEAAKEQMDSLLADEGVTQYCGFNDDFEWQDAVVSVSDFQWMEDDRIIVYMNGMLSTADTARLFVIEWNCPVYSCPCESCDADTGTLTFSGIGAPMNIWAIFDDTAGSGEVTAVQLW